MANLIREKLEDYFASMTPTSCRMMADIKSSREKFMDKWDSMDPQEQSDILWKSIVKPEAVNKYSSLPSINLEVEFFPVLQMKPGAKIVVEEDTASAKSFVSGSAYHDEHSAPFRWETQSQIDFRLHDIETESENIRTLERDASKSPEREKHVPGSPKPVLDSPKSPKPLRDVLKSSKPEKRVLVSPKPPRDVKKSPKPERNVLKSPKPERNVLKSPKTERHALKPVKPEHRSMKSLTLDASMLKATKMDPKCKSQQNLVKSPRGEFSLCSPMVERGSLKSLESPRPDRHAFRRDDEIKRSTIKRPEVPPPPVPPHFIPPIPPHAASPVTVQVEKSKKGETPIYAKVVKRKSANAKTLMISELNIHKKASVEMKPAVPPRMSLELKADMNLMKYTAHMIDIDGIPKTGFDFLDNW